jgi:hypothetical protein
MNIFFEIIILGFSIERFINLLKLYIDKYINKINNFKLIFSMVLGLMISFLFEINSVPVLGVFGIIISGLLISGVSNFISEIMNIFKNVTNITKNQVK